MIADDVATAVVNALIAGSWGEAFMPEHVDQVDPLEPGDFNLRVLVLDAGMLVGRAARRVLYEDSIIDIAIQQRVTEDKTRVRQLKELAQKFLRHFVFANIGYPFFAAEYLTHRVPEHLREERVFTAIVRLTYRTHANA